MLARRPFDLVVTCTLVAADGLLVCDAIRDQSTIPLILLINSATRRERIAGLDAGADDCLSRPFHISELVARIRTLMRRAKTSDASGPATAGLRFGDWRINPRLRLVYDPAGRATSLTAAEFDILLAFCRNPGRVMTRAELLDLAHVGVGKPGERSIDVHIRRLRCKIERNPRRPQFIKTIRLGGYIFTADVERDHLT
ncbi:two-component system OmpR family response regulator [Rhizobium giardinii]|uniref:Two-component system OmpR family response regulator n=1 Tax=Rhizobium giardinii TaxID=56731 RepID=A0A7W8UBR7_9HYPH|nr:two-component system OmpR family response regulator [Rhizobium giardinii]